jgi:hypothetical protein
MVEDGAQGATLGAEDERRLPGEDVSRATAEDAVHWTSVYRAMLSFKQRIIEETREAMSISAEFQHELGGRDIPFLESEAARFRRRIDEWEQRRRELTGRQA